MNGSYFNENPQRLDSQSDYDHKPRPTSKPSSKLLNRESRKLKKHARTRKSKISESETESSTSESEHDTDSDCNGSDEETLRSVRTKQSHRHNNKHRKYATFNGDKKFSV